MVDEQRHNRSGAEEMKEATARIKINKLLEAAGWRFFPEGDTPANIRLEPSVNLKTTDLDALGDNFEKTTKGFVDFLLLDAKGFPLIVLEAKAEDKNPLVGKEQARKYAQSLNCRFIILSSGNLHYFWDLERGNPYVITSFPTPESVIGYQKVKPHPERLTAEQVGDDYIVLTQRPSYRLAAEWKNEAERPSYIQANKLRFLRPYQLNAVRSLQSAVQAGNQEKLRSIQIPLPPLEVQKEIVAEIEGYQKVINGARAVLDNYRPLIPIHPDWPKRNLGSLAENWDSRRVPITKGDRKEGPFPYYGASGIVDYVVDFIFDEDILLISEDGANLLARSTPIAFAVSGKCWVNNHAHVLKFAEPATQKFVEVYLNSISIEEFVTGAAQPKINQEALNRIPIPIPDDFATQEAIVVEIEAEQALVAANRELITRFEQKIQATLARIWGEDEPVLAEA